jgi:hypothetical protein
MKSVKMSLAAALLMGASAFAIENVKVEGAANLFYDTFDSSLPAKNHATPAGDTDLFDKDSSAAQASLKLGAKADLTEGVSAGATMYALSTLGLENNLVTSVWEKGADSEAWFAEAWLAGKTGKTTGKIGRMELDTPLAFSEGWSVAPNTFEAAVLINEDIDKTKLIGAWVGKHNGSTGATASTAGVGAILNNADPQFQSFYNGAYAAAVVTEAIPMTEAQLWYYDLQSTAKAIWAQADVDVEGLLVGAQYCMMDPDAAGAKDSKAYAAKLGYEMKDVATLAVAYSSVDDEGTLTITNKSTNFESKLYTEKWWNFGEVGAIGSDSYSLTAEATVSDIDLFAGFYNSDIDVAGTTSDYEITEIALTAGKSFGPLDATLAYIYSDWDKDGSANDEEIDRIQVYLTYNF